MKPFSLPKISGILAALFITAFLADVNAAQRRVRINLGTLAPRGSSYYQSLLVMGQKWRNASDGKVSLKIYPDGSQGGEDDMVRLMRIGTLHAGLLTMIGLSGIEPAVSGLQTIPMMFRSYEEIELVMDALTPHLERRLAAKGFVALSWVDAGWVRFFSKKPFTRPGELKQLKLFTWAGDPVFNGVIKQAGYRPVPLAVTDIQHGLQTGLISVSWMPPIYALATQVNKTAPHMIELDWAPLVGAIVVKKSIWDRISTETQKTLQTIAMGTGQEIRRKGRRENEEAIPAMVKQGLKIHKITPEIRTEWHQAAAEVYPNFRGKIIPAEIFDEVVRILQDHRLKTGNRQ